MQVTFTPQGIATVRQPLFPPFSKKPGNAYWEADLPITDGLGVIDPQARSIHDVNSELLVLSRKPLEGIIISDNVKIYISPGSTSSKARLIIDAPDNYPIFRLDSSGNIDAKKVPQKDRRTGKVYYDLDKLNTRPRLATVVVTEIRGNRVKLGIEAPPEVPVHREEIYNKIIQAEGNTEREIGGLVITRKDSEQFAIFYPAPDLILHGPITFKQQKY